MAGRSKWHLGVPALIAFAAFGALFWCSALADPDNWSRWLFTVAYTFFFACRWCTGITSGELPRAAAMLDHLATGAESA
jgi:hypothetical protein